MTYQKPYGLLLLPLSNYNNRVKTTTKAASWGHNTNYKRGLKVQYSKSTTVAPQGNNLQEPQKVNTIT